MMIPRGLIDNWLRAEELKTESAADEVQVDPAPDWSFKVNWKPNKDAASLALYFLGFNKKDLLRLIAGVKFSPEHMKVIGKDGFSSRGAIARLRERLLTTGNTQFNPIREGGKTTGFLLEANIYTDALTQDRLMSEVRRIYALFIFISDVAEALARGQAEIAE